MPSRPIEAHNKKDSARNKSSHSPNHSTAQHGKANAGGNNFDILLQVPSETLTHITSFLPPPSLLALSRTNKQLYAHVKDDNTWRRAYVYQFLGISPEADLRDNGDRKGLMLRREENSWRKEFILRYNLKRRWERSRNQPVTHVPHHADVSAMYLMPSTTLLTSSLRYGIVARSYPLTGKVLRGFLDASGTANGLGWGNPNAEFSPHVSAIALASEGRAAKVLWGFRNGEVAVTTANRAMDGNRASAAKHARCQVDECHEGEVRDVAWGEACGAEGPTAFVTGAADGRVKLWDARRVKCLWTSDRGPGLITDPCTKVAIDVAHGVVAVALESGVIIVWSGFGPISSEEDDTLQVAPHETRIPAFPPFNATPASSLTDLRRELLQLHLAFSTDGQLSLLTAYKHDTCFYRHSVNAHSSDVDRLAFGSGNAGTVRSLKPVFASHDGESNFVIAGDELGYISVFDWDARPASGANSVSPIRRFEAHEDGAVTALAWNSFVLVSGSARGTAKVWDSLSLSALRTFASPASRPVIGGEWDGVEQILLERDVMVMSVGKKVMAWKAGPVESHDKTNGKGKQVRGAKHTGLAKWQQQLEMYRDIAESRKDLEEEQTHTRRVFGREREQQSTLAHLGLSEVEAVEYVLMLSRDEEENRRLNGLASTSIADAEDEGVFMADFDDLQTPVSDPVAFIESTPSTTASSRTSSFSVSARSPPRNSVVINGRSLPHTAPSPSNHKVQVSPRVQPEPMEAGFSMSPIGVSLPSSFNAGSGMSFPSVSDPEQFPTVSRTPSSTGLSVPSAPGSPLMTRRSVSGSAESSRSAWSTPLRSTRSSSSVPSPPHGSTTSSPPAFPRVTLPVRQAGAGLISAGFARQTASGPFCEAPLPEDIEREDEELRFAIELSLAEARSRGEEV